MDDYALSRYRKNRTAFVSLSYKLLFCYTLLNPFNGFAQETVKKTSQDSLFKDLNTLTNLLELSWPWLILLMVIFIFFKACNYIANKKIAEPLVDMLFGLPAKIVGFFKKLNFQTTPKNATPKTDTYRKLLNKHSEELPLVGYHKPLEVNSLTTFVDLLFQFPDQQEEDSENQEKPAEKEKSKTYTLKETLEQFIQLSNEQKKAGLLCLVGEPGSGKTSLIKYLVQRLLTGKNQKANNSLGPIENYQPLYLPLHFIGKHIQKDNDSLTYFLSEFSGGGLSNQFFTEYLQQENVLILLDGLDEVPVQRLAMVVNFIKQLQDDYNDHLIIITTRIPTYHQCDQQGFLPVNTIKAAILPMEPDKQQHFISNIFEQLDNPEVRRDLNQRLSPLLKPLKHNDWTKRFITALTEHKGGLEKIRTVPFLLQAVGILWLTDSENKLPANKADLYYRLLHKMLVDYARFKYEKEEGEASESLDFTIMLQLLGRVALFMSIVNPETIDIYFTTFQKQLTLAGKALHLSDQQLAAYQHHLTAKAQVIQLIQYLPEGQENNDQQREDEWYRFTHKSLMEYLSAWTLRYYYSSLGGTTEDAEALFDQMFPALFGIKHEQIQVQNTLTDNEEQNTLNAQINLAEILTFYTQIPDEDLYDSGRKTREERLKYREAMMPGELALIDLVRYALQTYWDLWSQNKYYENFFYSLFKETPLVSYAMFKKPATLIPGNEQWQQLRADLTQILYSIDDPERLYFFFTVIEALLFSLEKKIVPGVRDAAVTLLLGWLEQQGERLLTIQQPPPEEKNAYVYHLVVYKVEALLRYCDKQRLPDLPWIANALPDIDEKDLFTEKVKRFINPDEYNAEYLLIPGGEFPAYEYSSSWVKEGLAAHKRTEAYYLTRYPVTFRQYRYFIDYLASEEHELHRYLNPDDFIQRLKNFAEYCDKKNGELEFVQHLPKKDSYTAYANILRSGSETRQGFNSNDQPVCDISWYAASSYCFWLSCLHIAKQKGIEGFLNEPLKTLLNLFRLPHEAEWYWAAARPADANKNGMKEYCWTDRIIPDEKLDKDRRYQQLANYNKNIGKTTQVGLYPLGGSTDGLMDMSGNIWEWQSNWVKGTFWRGPALRGGSWDDRAGGLPCSVRDGDAPRDRLGDGGFRVAFSRSHFEKIDAVKK